MFVKSLPLKFLFLICTLPGLAEAQSFHFEKLTEFHGLSDNRVTCFKKDHTGFMWIGTENGLNRYDGHSFKIYRPGQKTQTLSHEHINDIEEDARGRLWIATWSGLNVLDPTRDSLYVFTPDEDAYRQKKTKIASTMVWDSYIDNAGRVWLALDIRDLCYYDPRSGEFTYFPWRDFIQERLPHSGSSYKSIHKIIKKSDHEVWLGTTLGLFSFNLQTKEFQHHGGERNADFISLQYDSAHQQVVFGQNDVHRYDLKKNRITTITKTTETSIPLKSPRLVPSSRGLWVIDDSAEHGYLLKVNEKNPFNIHHNKVASVYQHDGITWIGGSSGISIHDSYRDIFPFYPVFPDTARVVSGNVYSVFDDESGNTFYISSYNNNVLVKIDKLTGAQQIIRSIQGRSLSKCSRVYQDNQKRIWVLTANAIFVSDKQQQNFSVFEHTLQQDDYLFSDMLQDTYGNFWFASLRYGVFLYNPEKNSWKLLAEKPDKLFATRPTALLADPAHDDVWISDFSFGAFQYSLRTSTFKYHGMDTHNPTLLQSSLVNDATLDRNGDVWVATTSGGVSKYSHQTKTFTTYSMKNGLPENTIHAIKADVNGNIWLASNKGLTCMKTSGEIIRHYDTNSGLAYTNFVTPFSSNASGELMIGLSNGFLKFHPDSLSTRSSDFPIVITAALQGDSALVADHAYRYDENEFTFNFSALTYSLPTQVTYFYRLEGFHDKWVHAGRDHHAQYTNLGDGAYIFSVRAVDHTGKSSQNIASISFSIRPPFWEQPWFLVLLVVVAGSSLFAWIRQLQRKVQSQKILNQIATSLYNRHTIEDVFWSVAQSCITLLHFEDCVVYLLQDGVLVQKAAAGPKSTEQYHVTNPIEIPLGKGIVGAVAQHGKAEVIPDTRKDKRYIVDDRIRYSEIAVPIMIDGKVFGVIDAEHTRKNFFTGWHRNMLTEIAAICSAKIGRYFVEEQIRSKVARDLHDDIGSTLSSIKIMSNIALKKNDPASTQSYLKSIQQNVKNMQESMSDMVWAINPQNDTLEKVIVRMKEFAAEILEPLEIQYAFFEDGDFTRSKMDLNTRKDFFLIIKEAVNNAAKYSACTMLTVELKRESQGITLRIHDNGKGFDMQSITGGNGLKNMRHRAASIKGTIRIESMAGEGTTIELITPIT